MGQDRGEAWSSKNSLNAVASWWHSDADFGRVIENFNDMTKSRDMGFVSLPGNFRCLVHRCFRQVSFRRSSPLRPELHNVQDNRDEPGCQ